MKPTSDVTAEASGRRSRLLEIGVLAAAYGSAAWLGLALAGANKNVTAVWPPTGIAVAALLLRGRRVWPGIAIGAFAVNAFNGLPLYLAATVAVGNTMAPLVAEYVLRRLQFRSSLERIRDVLVLFFAGAPLPMMVSATVGTAALAAGGRLSAGGSARTWLLWWAGDAMGVVLVAPVILALGAVRLRATPFYRKRVEATIVLCAGGLLTAVAFHTQLPIRYLVLPLALWAAMQYEQPGAALSTAIMSGIAVWYTARGAASLPLLDTNLMLTQGLNATLALTLLSFAAVMHERRRAQDDLRAATLALEDRVSERTKELAETNHRLEREIAERRLADEALRASEEGLAQAQSLAHIGSYRWDPRTHINIWTDEMFRIHRRSPDDPPPGTTDYLDYVREDSRDLLVKAVREAVAAKEPRAYDYPIVLDGETRWIHAYVAPITDGLGELIEIQGTCQDITEWKQADDALRSALDREREAAEYLRRLDDTKNAFLTAVSHELRTPLTAILGFAELLQADDVDTYGETSAELLERLRSNAQRLSGLLVDLLDIDRLQRGIVEPRRRATGLRGLVRRAVESVSLNDHELSVKVQEGTVFVDPGQAERIVENLVANAVKYTPVGTQIFVRAEAGGEGDLFLVVEDDGPGIPEDVRTSIFEPFVRSDEKVTAPGTGIGLALVDRFARLHGGRAWVEDRPGGGASFHVVLPGGGKKWLPAAVA